MCAVTVIETWPIVFCNNRRSAPGRRASEAYVCGRSCTRRARRLRTRHRRDRRSTGGEQLRDRRTGAVTAVANGGTGDTTGHGPSGTGSDDGNAHSALTTAQASYRPDEDDRRNPSAALVAVYTSHGYRRALLLHVGSTTCRCQFSNGMSSSQFQCHLDGIHDTKVRIRGLNPPEFYATFPTKEVCIKPGMPLPLRAGRAEMSLPSSSRHPRQEMIGPLCK
jgi:hypothetical protein